MKSKPTMATDIPASILTPDSVETRLGTLRFFDGFPDEATVATVYDNLDFQRGVEAYLAGLPAASMSALRAGHRSFGPDNRTVLIFESLMDSRFVVLTANTETVYISAWLDTHDGPLVIDVPPRTLGMINDFWSRFVTDLGNAGPDHGQGGKYLLLPPGYSDAVPEGYFVTRARTYGNILLSRGFMEDGDPRPAVDALKAGFRIYPLAAAGDRPAMDFVDTSGVACTMVFASDASLFGQVGDVVRDEPLDAVDPETRGLLASIGIRRDAPFAPDARMQRILAEAAAVGTATARATAYSTREPDAYLYPDSGWKVFFVGNDVAFSPGGVLDLDARTLFFCLGWGISPAEAVKMVGIGSQYGYAEHDATGRYLDGSATYRLHLPPGIPVRDFWSVTVYDPQTRSMLQTDQRFPSTGSQKKGIIVNPDTSVDVYFGPEGLAGKGANWVQTIPGKGWFVILRLYGPLEPWFDKTWRPGEIEPVD
jgi:hypothetical protein